MTSETTVFSNGKEHIVYFPESEAKHVFGLISLYADEIHAADDPKKMLNSLFEKEGLDASTVKPFELGIIFFN